MKSGDSFRRFLSFTSTDVAAPIPHFISFEVGDSIQRLGRFRFLAAGRRWPLVSMIGMHAVIDMAVKVGGAVKPWAGSDKHAPGKPLRAIVAVGRAAIRSGVVIAIGTVGGDSNVDTDLSLCFGGGYGETDCSNRSQSKIFESVHLILLAIVRATVCLSWCD